jgi:hypothetical protein
MRGKLVCDGAPGISAFSSGCSGAVAELDVYEFRIAFDAACGGEAGAVCETARRP